MRANRARFVLSQSCSVFFSVVSRRLRIISLMLSLRDATSPLASTPIDRVRSPLVTAVATSALARPWGGGVPESWFTLSVRSPPVPPPPPPPPLPPPRPPPPPPPPPPLPPR